MPERNATFRKRQQLGQFWTPPSLAALLAAQLPRRTALALDLAAGDGILLEAMRQRAPRCNLIGMDIDPRSVDRAMERHPHIPVVLADGLRASIPKRTCAGGVMAAIGNPPFGDAAPDERGRQLVAAAFPGGPVDVGCKRLEMQFLARSLAWARSVDGLVSIVMPCGFADGDVYRKFREELTSGFGLRRVIEIPASSFPSTEARCVVLVVDTAARTTRSVEICRYDRATGKVERVYRGPVASGERLDARFHLSKALVAGSTPRLKDIGVEIQRGTFSNSEARRHRFGAIHTTHLATALAGRLHLGQPGSAPRNAVIASAGDILLPRTGTRVAWRPTLVAGGESAITDHVFRIRSPSSVRSAVRDSFHSPLFQRWLEGVSKGVCATVLTKRELLEMPAFALA
jgi:predicted RNA methylase